jgi:hypothetical protein
MSERELCVGKWLLALLNVCQHSLITIAHFLHPCHPDGFQLDLQVRLAMFSTSVTRALRPAILFVFLLSHAPAMTCCWVTALSPRIPYQLRKLGSDCGYSSNILQPQLTSHYKIPDVFAKQALDQVKNSLKNLQALLNFSSWYGR